MGLLAPALPRVDLQMPPQGRLDDDLFFAICQANRDYRIERNARGDIQIMPPTGGLTGKRNSDLLTDLNIWARRDGRGLVFDSSTGFNLPNGATRSPDVAWVLRERLARLSEAERRGFLPLAPDLVIELASTTDAVADLLAKMGEYQDNGVRLGWLILPAQRQVQVFSAGCEPGCVDHPEALADPDLLPGLTLDLTRIWQDDL
jgi:Uma2 family endonuclease